MVSSINSIEFIKNFYRLAITQKPLNIEYIDFCHVIIKITGNQELSKVMII